MKFAASLILAASLSTAVVSIAHADYYQDALDYQQQGNPDAAIIQLKNLLQSSPNNADGRLLLGQIYFQKGRVAEAEKELSLAVRLGKTELNIIQLLMQSQLMTAQLTAAEKTLEQHWPESQQVGKRNLFAGQIAFQSRKFSDAGNFYFQALEQGETFEATLGLAALARVQGDLKGALANLENIKSDDKPLESRRLMMKAELEIELKQGDAAINTIKSLELVSPKNTFLNLLFANAYLLNSDYETAESYLKKSPKEHSRLPQYQLLSAMTAISKQQYLEAFQWSEKLIQQQPDNIRALLIAGSSLFMLKEFEKATKYLETFVGRAPNEPNGRRLLAGSLLNLNKPLEALKVIEPMLNLAEPDPRALAIAGNANLALGNWDQGEEQLNQAIELDPKLESMRRNLALGQVLGGKGDSALAGLDDENDIQTLSIRLMAMMQQQKYQDAHQLLDSKISKQPNSPMLYSLKGAIYLKQQDVAAAKNSYSRALDKDPDFLAAKLSLIQIDLVGKDLASAEARINALLKEQPNSLQGLMAKAALATINKDEKKLLTTLKRAHEKNLDAIQPVAGLVQLYLKQQQQDKAKHLANSFYLTHPENLDAKYLHAVTLSKTGKIKDAHALATQLVNKRPNNTAYLELLIESKIKEGKFAEAEPHSQHLLNRKPKDAKALFFHVNNLVGQNKPKDAAPYIEQLLAIAPTPAAKKIAGMAEMQLSNYSKALTYFEAANEVIKNDAHLASMTCTAYDKTGKSDQAIKHAAHFFQQQPQSFSLGLQLASYYLKAKRDDEAIEVYESLRKDFPKAAITWNNLAWLYHQKGDFRGLDYAREANKLAPKRGDIKDTLGWILYQYGEYEKALPLLADAHKAMPEHPEVQLHYGAVLMKNRRETEAKKLLKPLADKPNQFQVEARKILSGKDA